MREETIQCLVHGIDCLHCSVACHFEEDIRRKERDSLRAENERLKATNIMKFIFENEAYKLRIRELEEAVEATDDYFRACAKQWADHEGRVVSPNANVIEGSEEVERLCELAGRKVVQALSKTKPSEGEKEKP